MKKFEKFAKYLSSDFMFLFLIELIWFIIDGIILTPITFMLTAKLLKVCVIALLFIGYRMAKQEKKSAGILGIITGILMIITGIFNSILTLLLGIFLTIHAITYLNNYQKKD